MKYSDERREAVLAKLLPPHNQSVSEVAEAEGISAATLYNWRKQAREAGRLLPDQADTPDGWRSADKFNAVLETTALTEAELAEYCRSRGLYPEQIRCWRASYEQANARDSEQTQAERDKFKSERQRSKQLERDLKRKDAALAETAALLTLRKKRGDLGGRGIMTSAQNRRHAVQLVNDARAAGARLGAACEELGIGINTDRRWARGGMDRRPQAVRPQPANALGDDERAEILRPCHRADHASLPPAQIVPKLLDEEGRYVASESSFYRVLRAAGEQHRRGRAAAPHNAGPPRRHKAESPNELWTWDVTY